MYDWLLRCERVAAGGGSVRARGVDRTVCGQAVMVCEPAGGLPGVLLPMPRCHYHSCSRPPNVLGPLSVRNLRAPPVELPVEAVVTRRTWAGLVAAVRSQVARSARTWLVGRSRFSVVAAVVEDVEFVGDRPAWTFDHDPMTFAGTADFRRGVDADR